MPTHEQRMEDYARRTTAAVETLRQIAWVWLALVLLGLIAAVVQFGYR